MICAFCFCVGSVIIVFLYDAKWLLYASSVVNSVDLKQQLPLPAAEAVIKHFLLLHLCNF